MLFKYFSILATLTVAFGLPSDLTEIANRQQDKPTALLQLMVGSHSKYISGFLNNDTVMGGEWIKEDGMFTSDKSMYKNIVWQENNATAAAPFWWLIYDTTVKKEDLKDEHIKYNMSCKAQLLEGIDKAGYYSFGLDIESPYLSPIPWDDWDSVVNEANVICDSGECVAEDGCKGLEMPKWNQAFLEDYAKTVKKETQAP
ncbi:hypothetical protein I302_107670 [Kwoniella bestiolae CBS 10118]|uniref:Uncharacterized protein n=1 Tax=Kwoniella bestiolae CBS 10118 TaxID=1296100 RepID=A0A1B9FXV7_9TREE|nr:hypothetical protein I302_06591 [Kwoniella bestiolae CBS 10118]OCF23608.1 hypothetical protein I302_06591 [Kwoniella bestiolae CBS 10118]